MLRQPFPNPGLEVSALLKKLRFRYGRNRLLVLVTIALALDIGQQFTASIVFALMRLKIGIPFFFEALLIVLLLRELPKLGMDRFAASMDHRWDLKDRLFSHTWFASNARVPKVLVDAQAIECLGSVDFDSLLTSTRIRIPKLLYLVLPMTGLILYLSWNLEYSPPGGIIDRTVRSVLVSEGPSEDQPKNLETLHSETPWEQVNPPEVKSGNDPIRDDPDKKPSPEEQSQMGEAGPEEQTANNRADVNKIPGPGMGIESRNAGSGKESMEATPEKIESVRTTEKLSPVRSSTRERSRESGFSTLPEATQFLDLIPGQRGGGTTELDPQIVQNFEKQIGDHPKKYRRFLETYYQELKR
jgi:hypothetical protein